MTQLGLGWGGAAGLFFSETAELVGLGTVDIQEQRAPETI